MRWYLLNERVLKLYSKVRPGAYDEVYLCDVPDKAPHGNIPWGAFQHRKPKRIGANTILPVKAVSLTVSNADFFSDFSEAGINQTLQTLKVKFTISLTILTTVGYESVDVDSDVMVAQNVIVGRVPETYVNLGHLTAAEGWDQYGTETADRTADPGT